MAPVSLISRWKAGVEVLARHFAPGGQPLPGPDEERRLRLFLIFSILGILFGSLFGCFYIFIDDQWAALIVGVCTVALALAPWLVRSRGMTVAGNFYALFLTIGFVGLSSIEAGVRGHAIAWLAVVPLCACILAGGRSGVIWSAVCVVAVGIFWIVELRGVSVPAFYPQEWAAFLTGAGYIALTSFMSLLGIFYENGRRRSVDELQTALGELSTANKRLEQLDAERCEFLGIAAHDLRGPMTLILGYAQMGALQSNSNEAASKSFHQIVAAGGRMRDLLDRFLGERAIEEGRLDLVAESCEVDGLISAAVANHLQIAQGKKIPLSCEETSRGEWVVADPRAVGQILDNLISNAIKFSPPGRPVVVRTRVEDRAGGKRVVHMEVADSGPGIREEDFKHLFDKYTRLSARPTGGETSTGLGLFIVKRLAEALGGGVTCRSRQGEGATFALVLPLLESSPQSKVSPITRRTLLRPNPAVART